MRTTARRKTIITAISIGGLMGVLLGMTGAYVLFQQPALLRLLIGRAALVPKDRQCHIFINGALSPKACCFIHRFSNGRSHIILWLPGSKIPYGRDIVIIDSKTYEVGSPNCTDREYQLYFNQWLYRSDNGYAPAYFGRAKSFGEDTRARFEGNGAKFTLPKAHWYFPSATIEITGLSDRQFSQ